MLEQKPKAPRKATLTKSYDRDVVFESLSLEQEPHEGDHFEGTIEKQKIDGTVWFATPNQLGLKVTGWGPGTQAQADATCKFKADQESELSGLQEPGFSPQGHQGD